MKMTPIMIDNTILTLEHEKLQSALKRKAFEFCVNVDFTNIKAVNKLVDRMEQYSMEALMRVFDGKLGYRPRQSKIYELVESIFNNQDSYNINRMFSSMRRTKHFGSINPKDTKYQEWFKNRVRYGFKTLSKTLETVEYVKVPTAEHA